MISISEAKEFISNNIVEMDSESVNLADAVGRILDEQISADMDLPPFDRSQMDGFAVRTEDVADSPVELSIVGESVAGKGWHKKLGQGQAVRIMTGASVPLGADSVQKVELTREENGVVTIEKPTRPEQNIVRRGTEIKKGEPVLKIGERITKNMVATLASFGYQDVKVKSRPRVGILATGSEIVDLSQSPGQDQIRNSNSWSLSAFADEVSVPEILPIAADDLEGLKEAIENAVKKFDCLIISGGVSVGDYDFTKPALREIGAHIFFERISLKPGKPTVFAKKDDTLIFGLPGNPVSIAVTYFVFVRLALLMMQNAAQSELKNGFAKLAHSIKGARGRDAMLPVSLSVGKKGRLRVETLRFSGSSNFIRFSRSDALVFVPRDSILEKGEIAEIFFLS